MASVPALPIGSNGKMPVLGYGTWQATEDELSKALDAALEAGYRHIDTAYAYQNEDVIGKVLKRWISSGKIKREDLFIVTKLPPPGNRKESVQKFLKKSLENLQLDYVDLYLIHLPMGMKDTGEVVPIKSDGVVDWDFTTDLVSTWKAMEEQADAGLAKSIGVSNFNINQLTRVFQAARIKPAALQIELHAYLQQNELVDYCKQNNIVVTAYSPLGASGLNVFASALGKKIELPNLMGNPVIKDIASKHHKTPAQILLKHIVQRGLTAIPKSTNPERLRQNFDIFDFVLDADDMKKIASLDCGFRIINFGMFTGSENHPEYPFKK